MNGRFRPINGQASRGFAGSSPRPKSGLGPLLRVSVKGWTDSEVETCLSRNYPDFSPETLKACVTAAKKDGFMDGVFNNLPAGSQTRRIA